jgi:hypothetical protein
MKVVVSVKPVPGGGASSQATRYIAYRERDEEREGKEPRKLFSQKEDDLSFWKAERTLTEGRTPAKKELVHFSVSFREPDFQALGADEQSRQQTLRGIVREAVPQMGRELNAEQLNWVAGIHRNTDNPHVHLLVHRDYVDHETGRVRRLYKMPKGSLARREADADGHEKVHPGSFSLAFESALDRAQERARTEERARDADRQASVDDHRQELEPALTGQDGFNRQSKAETTATDEPTIKNAEERCRREPSSEERLLEAARRNPSLAGRELIQEIILRGPETPPDAQPRAIDIRAALRIPSIDDPDYRTQTEHADWLGKESRELRDLYERGALIKGDVLIIPAEEHELRDDHDQPFIASLSYAQSQIRDRNQAHEFHSLARAIAGQTADARTEIEVFRYYYDRIKRDEQGNDLGKERTSDHAAALERTLGEMRVVADEMAKLETRESIEAAARVISFEEASERDRSMVGDAVETDRLEYEREETSDASHDQAGDVTEREVEIVPSGFNVAARKVNLNEESLRFPSGLSDEAKERLVTRTLPAIDRQLEIGRDRAALSNAIDATLWERESLFTEQEQEERRNVGRFLKAYVDERLKDPETRALNSSLAFRVAHAKIIAARTPEELNRAAENFLRENLERTNALRLRQADPQRRPQPELLPLNARERNLLFYGRAPEHHTPEMCELRHYWGLSRAERAARAQALGEGRLEPSPTLEKMIAELESRRTLPAIRHYQASLLNEKMDNPGKLDLRRMNATLPPHERTYLIERIEERKQSLTRNMSPERAKTTKENDHEVVPHNGRPFGEVPRESATYREYIASMGAIEQRLLNEAVRQRRDLPVVILNREDRPLSITEARSLLPREERDRIRNQARNLAWERIAPPDAFSSRPTPEAQKLSDTIARLQEETQERARMANHALQTFVQEKVGEKSASELALNVARQLEDLNRYAAATREELYRGFETLDAMRREYELTRTANGLDRQFNPDPSRNPASEQERSLSLNEPLFEKATATTGQLHSHVEHDEHVIDRDDLRASDFDLRADHVDSTEKWRFDSLRDLVEPTPFQIADTGAEHIHEHDFDFAR